MCVCFPNSKSCIQFIQYKRTPFILRLCLLLFMLLQQCFFYEIVVILVVSFFSQCYSNNFFI